MNYLEKMDYIHNPKKAIYIGENDDALDFLDGGNFAQENHSGRIIVQTYENKSDKPMTVALFPSYLTDTKNVLKGQGNLVVDENDPSKVLFLGRFSPTSSDNVFAFLKQNAANLVGVRIQSTDARQTQETLRIVKDSPFGTEVSKNVYLNTFISEANYKDNLVTIPTPDVVLGGDTEVSLTIPAKSTTTITAFIGAVSSNAIVLKNKVKKATKDIRKVGGIQNIKEQLMLR